MPRRRNHNTYSSYYGRERAHRWPSPIPYLLVFLVAAGGLAYFHYYVYRNLSGTVLNAFTGTPIPGVPVRLIAQPDPQATPALDSQVVATATTSATGGYVFTKLPASPAVSVTVSGFVARLVEAGDSQRVDIALEPSELSGRVTNPDGEPIQGATVALPGKLTTTGGDGTYLFQDLSDERTIAVKAPGYLAKNIEFGRVMTQNVTLEPFTARAIYMSADTVASPARLRSLIDLIERTELNAVVVDVKADNSGTILYNSDLPETQEVGTGDAVITDLDGFLADLRSRNIYTIARLSVFWDQALTAARPELALKSKARPGEPWLDAFGKRWANPHDPRVWDYNIAIASEVAERGFHEVQFDIAYFPSNGDLSDIDFGPEGQGKKDVTAITAFLERANAHLSAQGAYVAVDVLGLTPFVEDDMGVGQQFDELAVRVDYISPFVYPSDFADGFLDYAKPAEHPADIVANSMRSAVRRAGPDKVRPWLQDFSRDVLYDAARVRAQIDSAEAYGATGWMLWNFGNMYTEGALKTP